MLSILVATYRPQVNRPNLVEAAGEENPMYMSYQERYVGLLDGKDTRKMIREIGAWKQIVWADDAVDAVFEACGGHPMLSRFLASDACQQGTHKSVALADVQHVCARIRGNFLKHRISNYFQESVWKTLRPDEREALLWAVSQHPAGIPPKPDWEEALVSLEHFGLISEDRSVCGTLLRDWLLRRIES